MNNLESPIIEKLDDNLYLCANGDVVTVVDSVMNNSTLSADGYENAKGRGKKFFKKVGKGIKKVGSKVKQAFNFARANAFVGLLRVNFWGYASELKKEKELNSDKWKKFYDKWRKKWKGTKGDLYSGINQGGGKRPLKVSLRKRKGADGSDIMIAYNQDPSFYNVIATATVATAAVTAAPIIDMINSIIGTPKDVDSSSLDALKDEVEKQEKEGLLEDDSFFEKYKWYMIIGGSLIALGTTAYFLLRKKQQ